MMSLIDPSEVIFHVTLSVQDLADWIEYCKEHGYNPQDRVREMMMEECHR